jgi:hypothetical protein
MLAFLVLAHLKIQLSLFNNSHHFYPDFIFLSFIAWTSLILSFTLFYLLIMGRVIEVFTVMAFKNYGLCQENQTPSELFSMPCVPWKLQSAVVSNNDKFWRAIGT